MEWRKLRLVSWFNKDTGLSTWMLNLSRIFINSSFLLDICSPVKQKWIIKTFKWHKTLWNNNVSDLLSFCMDRRPCDLLWWWGSCVHAMYSTAITQNLSPNSVIECMYLSIGGMICDFYMWLDLKESHTLVQAKFYNTMQWVN